MGLYDGSGTQLLAAVPRDEAAIVSVLGQPCTLRVISDGAALVLTRRTSRDDQDARCEAVVAGRAHEPKERERDL